MKQARTAVSNHLAPGTDVIEDNFSQLLPDLLGELI